MINLFFKVKNYAIGLLFIALSYYTIKFYLSSIYQENEKNKIIKERDDEYSRIRDSSLVENKKSLEFLIEENDSLIIKLKQKPKFIPYEKAIYVNRNLNDALDVHSRYKYNKRAAK